MSCQQNGNETQQSQRDCTFSGVVVGNFSRSVDDGRRRLVTLAGLLETVESEFGEKLVHTREQAGQLFRLLCRLHYRQTPLRARVYGGKRVVLGVVDLCVVPLPFYLVVFTCTRLDYCSKLLSRSQRKTSLGERSC